ncbi:helix-turn-helix domain-containing protein [Terrisporobacter sp.]
MKEKGFNNTKIAEKLNISRVYVSKIINNKV